MNKMTVLSLVCYPTKTFRESLYDHIIWPPSRLLHRTLYIDADAFFLERWGNRSPSRVVAFLV